LNIVAINYGDSADTITKYVEKEKFTFPIVMNGKDAADMSKAYGVQAYPTNYVLDSSGKIVARFVGFNEKGLLDALKKLGIEPGESP
jgi:peroxiredoxin